MVQFLDLKTFFKSIAFPNGSSILTLILAAAIFILFLVIVMVQFHITQQSQGTTVILIVVALVAAFAISVPTFMMYYMKSNLQNEIEDALSAINLETVSRGYRW
jgi:NADH:ubiquinone oxidoreductase subunit 6 (subunit J)